MTNKAPYAQIEEEAEIALNTIDGQAFLKKLFINYHQSKSQIDVEALREDISNIKPVEGNHSLCNVIKAAQILLTLLEGDDDNS